MPGLRLVGMGDAVMDRRTFMGSVAIAAALFSFLSLAMIACSWAQQPAKLPKVAILSPRAPTTETCAVNMQGSTLPCFLDAMRELGYVDGKSVSFEFRYAEDDYKKLLTLATELVSLRPDVIYTAGPGAIAAAKATSTIPIIVGPTSEESLTRLAGNLAHPTGNVTGFTLVSVEQEQKCLQFLKELAPRASRVAVLLNPDGPNNRDYPGILAPGADQLGLTMIRIEARHVSDLPQAFAAIAASGANAIYIYDDPALAGTGQVRKQVSDWALKRGLPVVSPNLRVAFDGGLLSLGTDLNALNRRAAAYVDKVLKGVLPADLPIERPSKFTLSVNVKTAKALGLTIPQTLLLRADEVIQ
jgi:putative tryptophan/tyrosine transport system substrate-binding protein